MIIKTFETKTGKKPVDNFIKSMDQSTISKISFRIDLLEKFGGKLPMPYSKKITDVLYELRIRGKVEIRVIYAFRNNQAILLHIFKKKQDKIPGKEIEVANKRLMLVD